MLGRFKTQILVYPMTLVLLLEFPVLDALIRFGVFHFAFVVDPLGLEIPLWARDTWSLHEPGGNLAVRTFHAVNVATEIAVATTGFIWLRFAVSFVRHDQPREPFHALLDACRPIKPVLVIAFILGTIGFVQLEISRAYTQQLAGWSDATAGVLHLAAGLLGVGVWLKGALIVSGGTDMVRSASRWVRLVAGSVVLLVGASATAGFVWNQIGHRDFNMMYEYQWANELRFWLFVYAATLPFNVLLAGLLAWFVLPPNPPSYVSPATAPEPSIGSQRPAANG